MIALEVFAQGKFITFRELLAYFEFRLVFTVQHVFFGRVAALCDSQSQESNSNCCETS